jgi:hypothetical protein
VSTYILVRPSVSLGMRSAGIVLSVVWFRLAMRRQGVTVHLRPRAAAA